MKTRTLLGQIDSFLLRPAAPMSEAPQRKCRTVSKRKEGVSEAARIHPHAGLVHAMKMKMRKGHKWGHHYVTASSDAHAHRLLKRHGFTHWGTTRPNPKTNHYTAVYHHPKSKYHAVVIHNPDIKRTWVHLLPHSMQ